MPRDSRSCREAPEFDLDLHEIAAIWRYGSVVRSWLLELAERALRPESGFDQIEAVVVDSGRVAGRSRRPSTAGCRPRSSPRRCSPGSPPRRRTPSACGWCRPCATSSEATPSSPPTAPRAGETLHAQMTPRDRRQHGRPPRPAVRPEQSRRSRPVLSKAPPAAMVIFGASGRPHRPEDPARPGPAWPTGACSTTGSPSSGWPAPSGATRSSGPTWPRPRPRAGRSGGR